MVSCTGKILCLCLGLQIKGLSVLIEELLYREMAMSVFGVRDYLF